MLFRSDFPKLFNKVKKFDWGPYLYKSDDIRIQVTLKKSRLIHSTRAKESIEDGIKVWLKGNPRKKILDESPKHQLYFHIEEDVCQISIDLCGSPLYRRENKTQGAIAPIRENLASGMILWAISKLENKENLTIIDPMCGSGTFIVESAYLNEPNSSKALSAHFMSATKNLFNDNIAFTTNPLFSKLIGIDQNKSFRPGRKDLPKVTYIEENYKNVLSELPKDSVFIFNPPYGKRIKIMGERVEYYKKIVHDLFSTDAMAVGFVIPEEVPLKLKIDHTDHHVLRFKNGGLPVKFILLTKK